MTVGIEFLKMTASGAIAYSSHYGTAKLYDHFCVPDGWEGFLKGLITTGSPWCSFAMKVMSHSQDMYSNFVLITLSRIFLEAFVKPT